MKNGEHFMNEKERKSEKINNKREVMFTTYRGGKKRGMTRIEIM